MKIGMIPVEIMDVCRLRVRIDYPVFLNKVETWHTKILTESNLNSNDLSDEFSNIRMSYKISGLGPTTELEPEYIINNEDPVVLINKSKIYYEVIIPVGVDPSLFGHLFVDYIEVSETEIWGENGYESQIRNRLNSYHTIWDSNDVGSVYRNKIKYFYTMDEPHSFDHFNPYREVEAVQKTLSVSLRDKMMLTKIYQLTVKTDSLLSSVTDTNALKTLNRLKVYIEADNNNIPTAQLLASQNTTNAITATDQYHAQTEELTIALRGTTLNRNIKNDVGSITTMNKSGMNNLMKRHGNKFTIKKEPKPEEVITEYSLSQNYPNPFNSSTIIEYALPKEGLVSLKLYDITGRLVKQLVNEQKPMGRHRTAIESGNLASGVYIYSLRVNDININKKLVILK